MNQTKSDMQKDRPVQFSSAQAVRRGMFEVCPIVALVFAAGNLQKYEKAKDMSKICSKTIRGKRAVIFFKSQQTLFE
ncbi:hypothetical protein [Gaoshiqia sp. Z1-71]|uniref:hypothetical protein n=1 Tax=Gaoshiqia hydrogeniformans TaxID=3290090 RepID=UPI003BF79BA2